MAPEPRRTAMRPTTRFSAFLYRLSGWLRCRIINSHGR
jgi:hypothetical protein